MKFTIKKGNVRPAYWRRALWLIRQGVLTRRKSATWLVRFRKPECDTHIKLCGLFDFASGYTHGESRRVIAHFERDGVRLTSYLYVNGRGPSTGGHDYSHKEIGFIPYGEWAEIYISSWVYIVNGRWRASCVYPDLRWSAAFRSFAGAHADNGASSPRSPCDLHFEIKKAAQKS